MLIDGLARTIQVDREREIQERLRQRGLLRDAAEGRERTVTPAEPKDVSSIVIRGAAAGSSGVAAHGRPR